MSTQHRAGRGLLGGITACLATVCLAACASVDPANDQPMPNFDESGEGSYMYEADDDAMVGDAMDASDDLDRGTDGDGVDEAPEPEIAVRFIAPPDGTHTAAGWVYGRSADGSLTGRCLFVWQDGTWTLTGESQPGFYGREIASGDVSAVNDSGYVELYGFPMDAFLENKPVWKTGYIEVTYKGKELPTLLAVE